MSDMALHLQTHADRPVPLVRAHDDYLLALGCPTSIATDPGIRIVLSDGRSSEPLAPTGLILIPTGTAEMFDVLIPVDSASVWLPPVVDGSSGAGTPAATRQLLLEAARDAGLRLGIQDVPPPTPGSLTAWSLCKLLRRCMPDGPFIVGL